MKPDYYILDSDHNPIGATWEEYVAWSERPFDETRRVANTQVDDDVSVSTVFLTSDHNWGTGLPVLFETMVFGGAFDEHQWRYTTWDDAVAGHERIVAAIRAGDEP